MVYGVTGEGESHQRNTKGINQALRGEGKGGDKGEIRVLTAVEGVKRGDNSSLLDVKTGRFRRVEWRREHCQNRKHKHCKMRANLLAENR